MLCRSTPAAPSLAHTLSQAASSVAGAYTLSIKLYQRPPLTPLSSADTMRSVHTEASTHVQSRPLPASAPCVALAGTPGAFSCLDPSFTLPPSCPPSLGQVLLPWLLAAHRRCSTMRALTPLRRSHARQVSPLTPLCLPDIPTPTTLCARTSLYQSSQHVRSDCRQCQASPRVRRLAATRRRNGFVILQAVGSPPVALHPASRRRSYLRLHV